MRKRPLYNRLASEMAAMIEAGAYRIGERLPSLRAFSRQHQVSLPTAMEAYLLLENRQLIEARPKSGFYVRPRLSALLPEPQPERVEPPTEPDSLAGFSAMMAMMRDVADPRLLPLGAAIPDEALFPLRSLQEALGAVVRTSPDVGVRYDPLPGAAELRLELAKRSPEWGCHLGPDDFVVTNGATEALYLTIEVLTRPGDAVVVEAPTYHGLLDMLARLGRRVLPVPATARGGMDPGLLKETLKRHDVAAMIVSANYANPLGSCMPTEARRELLALARRFAVPVVEDDVYGELAHAGPRPQVLKALDPGVILCSSFSKTVAPGWRIGYLAAGREHRQAVLERKTAMNLANARLPALALAGFLRNGGYERHLRRLRARLREQVGWMREAVARHFPEGTRVSNPEGGFVLWLELPGGRQTLPLLRPAWEAGISFVPGAFFTPGGGFGTCLRLNGGCRWRPEIREAVAKLGQICQQAG